MRVVVYDINKYTPSSAVQSFTYLNRRVVGRP